jgi:hypothetical protein
MSEPKSQDSLHPLRALVSPVWLGALFLLVLNDHALKGSGLLPGEVTGKLSDFAGMLVAPALMAAVCMVRTRRGLLSCHAAVGLVFAAIQLSPAAAASWSGLMGAVGFPWEITRDATDLIALPVLFASWQLLTPRMTAPLGSTVRRSLEFGTVGVGLWASVATSQVEPPPDWEESYAPFDAAVYLNNASEEEITVRLRELRTDVQINCFELAQDPGHIPDAAFGETLTWRMPPWTNIPAGGVAGNDECYAVLVDGDGLAPAILFWLDGAPDVGWVDGQTFDDGTHQNGGVIIRFDDAGVHTGYASVGTEVVFDIENDAPEYAPGCEPQSDGDRIDWSTPVPLGRQRIESAEVGPDGCVALELADFGQIEAGESTRWYVCLPAELWGPNPGFWVDISGQDGSGNDILPGAYESVSLELLGPDGEPLVGDKIRMVLSRGQGAPELAGLKMNLRQDSSCALVTDEGCGTLSQASYLSAWSDVEQFDITAGSPAVDITVDENTSVELALVHAEQRYLLDIACAEGSNQLGADLELAAVIRTTE